MKTRVQCKACPWRKGVAPARDIPGGYCPTRHRGLRDTISDGRLRFGEALRAMACHESRPGREFECVGWLHHQLGVGNNIALRLRAMAGKLPPYELRGEQHSSFEDTLP